MISDARTVHNRSWLASFERLNLRSTKYKLKYSLDQDCFETKCNVDDVFNKHSVLYNIFWLHERVTWEMSPHENQCQPQLRLGLLSFLKVTISHVTLYCSQYLYNTHFLIFAHFTVLLKIHLMYFDTHIAELSTLLTLHVRWKSFTILKLYGSAVYILHIPIHFARHYPSQYTYTYFYLSKYTFMSQVLHTKMQNKFMWSFQGLIQQKTQYKNASTQNRWAFLNWNFTK